MESFQNRKQTKSMTAFIQSAIDRSRLIFSNYSKEKEKMNQKDSIEKMYMSNFMEKTMNLHIFNH